MGLILIAKQYRLNDYMGQPNTTNWPFGLMVRLVLRMREVPGSVPGTAHVVAACYLFITS